MPTMQLIEEVLIATFKERLRIDSSLKVKLDSAVFIGFEMQLKRIIHRETVKRSFASHYLRQVS